MHQGDQEAVTANTGHKQVPSAKPLLCDVLNIPVSHAAHRYGTLPLLRAHVTCQTLIINLNDLVGSLVGSHSVRLLGKGGPEHLQPVLDQGHERRRPARDHHGDGPQGAPGEHGPRTGN